MKNKYNIENYLKHQLIFPIDKIYLKRYNGITYMKKKPFVTLSYAQSIDGRIATVTGDSQWISGDETLQLAQRLRSIHDGILIGVGTVLRDDPELSCRIPNARAPVRIILDSKLSIPIDSKIVKTADRYKTLVLTTDKAPGKKVKILSEQKLKITVLENDTKGYIDLRKALNYLAGMGLENVLVEGGSKVITSFLSLGHVSKLVIVTAPIIIGEGISAVGDLGVRNLNDALKLKGAGVKKMGRDIVWELFIDP